MLSRLSPISIAQEQWHPRGVNLPVSHPDQVSRSQVCVAGDSRVPQIDN